MKFFPLIPGLFLWLTSMQAVAFPEMPFCPLGGPPGWANRVLGDRYDYYTPPPYYNNQPYWQSYPQYSPVYPGGYPYRWYSPPANTRRN